MPRSPNNRSRAASTNRQKGNNSSNASNSGNNNNNRSNRGQGRGAGRGGRGANEASTNPGSPSHRPPPRKTTANTSPRVPAAKTKRDNPSTPTSAKRLTPSDSSLLPLKALMEIDNAAGTTPNPSDSNPAPSTAAKTANPPVTQSPLEPTSITSPAPANPNGTTATDSPTSPPAAKRTTFAISSNTTKIDPSMKETQWFKQLTRNIAITALEGYTEEDIVDTSSDFHERYNYAVSLVKREVASSTVLPDLTPVHWKTFVAMAAKTSTVKEPSPLNAKEKTKMKRFVSRLAVTPPYVFGKLWNPDKLSMTWGPITQAWIGAYRILGCAWLTRKKLGVRFGQLYDPTPKDKAHSTPAGNTGTAPKTATPAANKTKKASSSKPPPRTSSLAAMLALTAVVEETTLHKNVFDIHTEEEPIPEAFGPGGDVRAAHYFHDWAELVLSADPSARIKVYFEHFGRNLPTITAETPYENYPKTRIDVMKYVYKYFIQDSASQNLRKRALRTRIRVQHSEDASQIAQAINNVYTIERQQFMSCKPGRVQEANSVKIGFLYGLDPNLCNVNELEMEIEAQSEYNGMGFYLRSAAIQLPGELYDRKKSFFGVTVYVGKQNEAAGTRIFSQIYAPKRKHGFPQSRKLHFVPDSASDHRIHAWLVKQLRSNQKECFSQRKSMESQDIVELDGTIGDMTLRSLIMDMRVPYSNSPLFCSVDSRMNLQDQSTIPGITIFSYEARNSTVAEDVIRKLGLIISWKFGVAYWDWFTASNRVELPLIYQLNEAGTRYESAIDIQTAELAAISTSGAAALATTQEEDDASVMDEDSYDDSDDDEALEAKFQRMIAERPPTPAIPYCVVLNMDFITDRTIPTSYSVPIPGEASHYSGKDSVSTMGNDTAVGEGSEITELTDPSASVDGSAMTNLTAATAKDSNLGEDEGMPDSGLGEDEGMPDATADDDPPQIKDPSVAHPDTDRDSEGTNQSASGEKADSPPQAPPPGKPPEGRPFLKPPSHPPESNQTSEAMEVEQATPVSLLKWLPPTAPSPVSMTIAEFSSKARPGSMPKPHDIEPLLFEWHIQRDHMDDPELGAFLPWIAMYLETNQASILETALTATLEHDFPTLVSHCVQYSCVNHVASQPPPAHPPESEPETKARHQAYKDLLQLCHPIPFSPFLLALDALPTNYVITLVNTYSLTQSKGDGEGK